MNTTIGNYVGYDVASATAGMKIWALSTISWATETQ